MRKRYVRSSDGIFDFVDEKVLSDDDVLESLNDLQADPLNDHLLDAVRDMLWYMDVELK